MEIKFTEDFRKYLRKIKNRDFKLKIIKQIRKLSDNPYIGKPLRHDLKNMKSLRVKPFRIIYSIEKDYIVVYTMEHRDLVYD